LSCSTENTEKEYILFDFESDHELDDINWQCHTLMSISGRYVTHGKSSLMLEMYPSAYPGFKPELKVKDWSKYKALCFDVYYPYDAERNITVRIDDTEDNTEYKDRYNKNFIIKKGMNNIRIPLDSLVTSGTKRRMDTSTIDKFLLFTVSPAEKVVLYIDYIRLSAE
jgi:hypothetical protein